MLAPLSACGRWRLHECTTDVWVTRRLAAAKIKFGEVAEWSKALAWKASVRL